MANVTLSLNERLLEQSRQYAQQHQTSLNDFIRHLLTRTVTKDTTAWLDECFTLMDKAQGNSRGQTWKREDLRR